MKGRRRRNGMGTIYQHGRTGKWIGQKIIRGKRKSISGDSRFEVMLKLEKMGE